MLGRRTFIGSVIGLLGSTLIKAEPIDSATSPYKIIVETHEGDVFSVPLHEKEPDIFGGILELTMSMDIVNWYVADKEGVFVSSPYFANQRLCVTNGDRIDWTYTRERS